MAKAKPDDRREFVRVAVDLPDHPKLAVIGSPLASWLYVVGLTVSGAALSDGLIVPAVAIRRAAVPGKWATALIREGMWHEPGHTCPDCQQPPPGRVVIHDYLCHQRSKADAEAARDAGRKAAEKRWAGRKSNANSNADRNADRIADGNAESIQRQRQRESSYLLTLISRLAVGDASVSRTPPAEVISSWQEIAGPGVDLDDQAMRYLATYGDRPARNERKAWLGWLQQARKLQAAEHERNQADPDADIRPPAGCSAPRCNGGYLGFDDDERPIPCPACRPHLRSVEAS